jgi:hypothetical protein
LAATGEVVPLDTPSAQQSGLKLRHGFEVEPGAEVDLVLDFDACRSIVKAGNSGKYNLKPVISVMPVLTGSIAGAVDPEAARARASVSLQRFDPATGIVAVIRATTVRPDGSWILSPVPVSPSEGPGYNLVIGSAGYGNVVYTHVPVATGVTTGIPDVALAVAEEGRISGKVMPIGAGNVEVRALQRIVSGSGANGDVVIEAGFANADSANGFYELRVPASAARVGPYGGSLSDGASAGVYDIVARSGEAVATVEADVDAGDVTVNFSF